MGRTAGQGLSEALAAMIAPAGRIAAASHRPWASATFTGARHCLSVLLPAADADAFADMIGEAEFAIRGHLVADIAVIARETRGTDTLLMLEALTIEDAPVDRPIACPRGNEARARHVAQA